MKERAHESFGFERRHHSNTRVRAEKRKKSSHHFDDALPSRKSKRPNCLLEVIQMMFGWSCQVKSVSSVQFRISCMNAFSFFPALSSNDIHQSVNLSGSSDQPAQ
ncbi:hypothetical protein R3I94_015127 [Phoxinus phoxinus]